MHLYATGLSSYLKDLSSVLSNLLIIIINKVSKEENVPFSGSNCFHSPEHKVEFALTVKKS